VFLQWYIVKERITRGSGGWKNREDAGWLKDSSQNNMPKEAMFWRMCAEYTAACFLSLFLLFFLFSSVFLKYSHISKCVISVSIELWVPFLVVTDC
jgi:hypothetical protein